MPYAHRQGLAHSEHEYLLLFPFATTERTSEISSKLLILQVRKPRPPKGKGLIHRVMRWVRGRTKISSIKSQISKGLEATSRDHLVGFALRQEDSVSHI